MSNADKHYEILVFYFLIRLFISDVCERLNDVEIFVLLLFYTHVDICTFSASFIAYSIDPVQHHAVVSTNIPKRFLSRQYLECIRICLRMTSHAENVH